MAATTATASIPLSVTSGPSINARKNPKSRNGCSACKARKLKCGEERPECGNCLKRGNSCPGYQKTLKWSAKHEVFKTPKQPPSTRQEAPLSPPAASYHTWPISALPVGTAPPVPPTRKALPEEHAAGLERAPLSRTTSAETAFEIHDRPATDTDDVIELPRTPDDDLGTEQQQLSRSTAKELLRAFYRIKHAPPQAAMMDQSSFLIQHYFQDVCGVVSSFDSPLNPFRMSIARLWSGSEPIYFAIQSMAAAHLANTYPQMGMVGIEMQKRASEALTVEIKDALSGMTRPDRPLLTLLLLGLSACWHKPNDLGVKFLEAARSLMCTKLLQDTPPESKEQQRQDQFFEEAMVYWELMMGFVTPDGGRAVDDIFLSRMAHPFPTPGPREDPKRSGPKVLPHPWAGVAPRAQILLAETGRLVREERIQQRAGFFEVDLAAAMRRYNLAESLEEELLAIEPPDPENLIDVQDEHTDSADFLVIAEATRCAALLVLYRIFPSLLAKRLGADHLTTSSQQTSTDGTGSLPTGSTANFLLDDMTFPFPFTSDTITPSSMSHPNISFLNSLATHILTMVESLPATSGTRFLQLMMIVTASGELRFSQPQGINLDFFDPTSEDGRVGHARAFVEQRLAEHGLRLPAKPVRRMLEIVRETWRRSDAGLEDVFWLDVVIERGWETVMG